MQLHCPRCKRAITGDFKASLIAHDEHGKAKLVEAFPHAPSTSALAQCLCGRYLDMSHVEKGAA